MGNGGHRQSATGIVLKDCDLKPDEVSRFGAGSGVEALRAASFVSDEVALPSFSGRSEARVRLPLIIGD